MGWSFWNKNSTNAQDIGLTQTPSGNSASTPPDYLGFKDVTIQTSNVVTATKSAGPTILKEEDCEDKLGFAFSKAKKWAILTTIFAVQSSMNFNASVYGNAVAPMTEKFGVPAQMGRIGQMAFLIAYAFGCELWAPWSEELGRKPVLQWSLGLVNLWQIPCALISTFASGPSEGAVSAIIVFRTLGGLSSAGGSVTLGMVADMWKSDEPAYGVAFVVFSSVLGSIFGPVVGGFLQQYLSLASIFWAQLIFGAVVQFLHFWVVPETRSSCIVTAEAKRLRNQGQNVVSEAEHANEKVTFNYACQIWARPFIMFIREPIVLLLSLISGFADALIFTFLDSMGLVFAQWHFNPWQIGLIFLSLAIGYLISYAIWIAIIYKQSKKSRSYLESLPIEHKLNWLVWIAPLLVAGIFGFAFTGIGPPMPWIVPVLFLIPIGIANMTIYGATIDYMVVAYGEKYSASACGGNGFARDFLAGVAAMYAHPLYTNGALFGKTATQKMRNASCLLGAIAAILIVPIYFFWKKGEWVRNKSPFAKEVEEERKQKEAALPKHNGSTGVDRGRG
ncbi:putative trans-sulfuration enzyme [Venturia nashicola]|uniref:Putative trans-sulfuration enzyme n=1 Tax=Venturia nashicola TaxID=86259 RepID=A0A4Z1NV01_9PEZI|nr:putative trans-sulfuration enzyme [Venturia nashicola]